MIMVQNYLIALGILGLGGHLQHLGMLWVILARDSISTIPWVKVTPLSNSEHTFPCLGNGHPEHPEQEDPEQCLLVACESFPSSTT